jgi:hypothetical protein
VTTPHRPRTTGAAAVVVLLVLLLAACSGNAKAPTTTAPPGYTVMSNAKDGFALAVPSDWTPVPLNNNTDVFNKTANTLRLANPKLASILNKARVLGQAGGKFMAVTPDGVGDANLTVDKPKEKTIDQIVTNSIAGLKGLDATNVAQEPSTLSGKPAIKVTFRLPVDTDAGRVTLDEVQHYLLQGGKAFILTVSGVAPDVSEAIATSLRIR